MSTTEVESPTPSAATYDIAVIGYGPTGATAANLLGQMGLKVLVIERDPDVYSRARAISTDEEVMRVWQSVGLADRLQQDMLPDRPLNFVDADGVPFIDLKVTSRGTGHPPQQFLYQPAVDQVLREGVGRFPNVEILLEHECLRVSPTDEEVELMLADLRTDTFKRIRASYVIAADGGSSPTRGQLGVGYSGRTYSERWVVIDTKVLQEWDAHDRLRFHCNPDRPTVDCPTPLGHHRWEYPARTDEDEQTLLRRENIWKVLNDQGITSEHVEILRAATTSASPTDGGWGGSSWPATPRMPCRRGSARACRPESATPPTCVGNSPPSSTERHLIRCSTPTRTNASRTSPRSPAARASSAGSSPSATASSPPRALTCSVR